MQPPSGTPTCQQASSSTSATTTCTYSVDMCESSCQSVERTQAQASSVPVSVPHVRQAFNWDCGLACVLMVLRAFGQQQYDMPSLREMCATKSIWTIDLAHLLHKCGVVVTLTTTTIGANPDYADERFYAEHMAEDEARVARLFQDAPAAGITVQQRSMPLQEVQDVLLAGRHLVIALVDKNKLGSAMGFPVPWQPLGPAAAGNAALPVAYTGHYIVISAYDARSDMFLICDPAAVQEQLRVPAAKVEAARKSFGTDEDLLFVAQQRHMVGAVASMVCAQCVLPEAGSSLLFF